MLPITSFSNAFLAPARQWNLSGLQPRACQNPCKIPISLIVYSLWVYPLYPPWWTFGAGMCILRIHHPPTMINSYGPGVGDSHWSLCRVSGHKLAKNPLKFSSENHNYVKRLGWKTKCDQNTAATLVLEAPNTIKHNDGWWFHLMIYDVAETSNRENFEAG